MSDFFRTQLGRKFYEGDVPRIARALTQIAGALEGLVKEQQERITKLEDRVRELEKKDD